MKRIAFLFFFSFPLIAISQKNIEEKSAIDLIQEGLDLYEKEKYDESINSYSKVSLNDTNYSVAQYEIALSYFALDDYSKAITTLKELINLNLLYAHNNDMYTLLGSAYDENGQLDKAIETYNIGIKKFPKNYSLYYNRALAFSKLKKHKEAIEDFKTAITCKAGHASSHYQLGLYATHEGHYTEAALSFITYLILDPNSQRANEVISILENLSNGEYDEKSKGFTWDEEEDYSQLNEFFKNKVALEKAYKVKLTIDAAYARQLHFILSNIKYDKENPGFWNQTYIPFLLDIYQNDKFDEMILFSLQASGSDKVQSKLKSKKSKITDFLKFAQQKWIEHSRIKFTEFEGENQLVYIESGDYGMKSIGRVNDQNQPIGKWYYYHANGTLSTIAEFTDKGLKTGNWETFNKFNGKTATKLVFENDELNGPVSIHYLQGEVKEKKIFKDGKLEDTIYIFYRSGDLMEKYAVKNDLKNGDVFGYHENGKLSYKYTFIDAVPNGPYVSYHPNGKVSVEFTLKNNNFDGMHTSYYPNGQKKSQVKYIEGKKDGVSEIWYSTGQLQEKAIYKEGKQIGEFTDYNTNGTISYSGILDESGKQNGLTTNFDLDGKKYLEHEYKKGELIQIHCYNKKGDEIYKASKKGKKLDYRIYYPDGVLKTEGLFENDSRQGKWKFYDRHSNISAIESYDKGSLIDTAYYFHKNGKLKSKESYQNGELNGLFLEYNIFGTLIREGLYKDGQWDKDWYLYNDEGILTSEYFYVDGENHGIQKNYGLNGKLESFREYEYGRIISQNFLDTLGNIIDQYGEYHGEVKLHDATNKYIRYDAFCKNGSNDGLCTWFGPTNNIETKGNFVNDKREGKWSYYYDNGKIQKELNYINGLIEGTVKAYSQDGILIGLTNYVNDDIEGVDIQYYDNGNKEVETNFLNGEKHGKSTYYDEEGNIYMIRYYNYGIFKSYSYIGKDGKEVTPIELLPGNNLIVTYYQNGVKACEHNRKNGLIEGHYIVYNSKGKMYSDEVFENGEFHGKSIYYFANGTKSQESNYKYGSLHGLDIKYYENGKTKSETNYLFGDKHGKSTEYSKEGKLIKTSLYYNNELIEISTNK